jgi:hypothetical protein
MQLASQREQPLMLSVDLGDLNAVFGLPFKRINGSIGGFGWEV